MIKDRWMVSITEVEDFKCIYLLIYFFFVTNQVRESEALNPFWSVTNEPRCALVTTAMTSLSFSRCISRNVKMIPVIPGNTHKSLLQHECGFSNFGKGNLS